MNEQHSSTTITNTHQEPINTVNNTDTKDESKGSIHEGTGSTAVTHRDHSQRECAYVNGVADHCLDAFVRSVGGKRLVKKILIASNGLAAVKAIRSIRQWAFETLDDEHAIEFMAMASPDDIAANAEYIRMADIWISVPGGPNNYNFANVELIVDRAERFACDAVWAGWGHASEYPSLPRKLKAAGIVFLGPGAEAMQALGDKIASTIIAQSAGVPTAPWSGQDLRVDYATEKTVSDQVYSKACVSSVEDALKIAYKVGFPCVIKASAGGGGKGIRIVHSPERVETAYRQVVSEVPGSPVFIMKLIENARHVEIQVIADEYGSAVALYGRDCSVQRRHQKVIEEGPITAVPDELLAQLESAAVRLAKEVGYVGAGTVEYLYTGDRHGGRFYFLELNPRLQVEHPVTELIAGVNLPALQLLVGMGVPLERCADIRHLYGMSTDGDNILTMGDPKAFLSHRPPPPNRHVIACRITSEDAHSNFEPCIGVIEELTIRPSATTWGYFSLNPPATISQYSDSQFGHIFSGGPTREAARKSLILTLHTLTVRGSIKTPAHYLAQLLAHPDFVENDFSTAWLDHLLKNEKPSFGESTKPHRETKNITLTAPDITDQTASLSERDADGGYLTAKSYPPESSVGGENLRSSAVVLSSSVHEKSSPKSLSDGKKPSGISSRAPPVAILLVTTAAAYAAKKFRLVFEKFTSALTRGHIPAVDSSLTSADVHLSYNNVEYRFVVTRADVGEYRITLNGSDTAGERDGIVVGVKALEDGTTAVLMERRSYVMEVGEEKDGGLKVTINGVEVMFEGDEVEPSEVRAGVTGKIVRWLKGNGDMVKVDELVAELEVMKMMVEVHAKMEGPIRILLPENTSVEKGQIIAVIAQPSSSIQEPASPLFVAAKRRSRREVYNKGIWSLLDRASFDNVNPCRKPHQRFAQALLNVEKLLDGFDADIRAIRDLFDLIGNNEVASGQIIDSLSIASKKLSNDMRTKLQLIVDNMSKFERSQESGAHPREAGDESSLTSTMRKIILVCQEAEGAESILEVAELWIDGWEARAVKIIGSLLKSYVRTERPFAVPSVAAGDVIRALRFEYKDHLDPLVEIAASHVAVAQKNKVLLVLLSEIARRRNLIKMGVKEGLHELTQLVHPTYNDVALKARLILADARRPQFADRKNRVWSTLMKVRSGDESCKKEVIHAEDSMMDILVSFMLPEGVLEREDLRKVALECQLLRSYRAYEVTDVSVTEEYGVLTARWGFRSQHSSSLSSDNKEQDVSILSFDSADDLMRRTVRSTRSSERFNREGVRRGMLAAFRSWAEMESKLEKLLENFVEPVEPAGAQHSQVGNSHVTLVPESPLNINVLTVVVRCGRFPSSEDPVEGESVLSAALSNFCRACPELRSLMEQAGIRTVTFVVMPSCGTDPVAFPGLYTFRVGKDFEEDPIYRHIDPPMAYELELTRLSNFHIDRFGYPNRNIHVFYAVGKSLERGEPPRKSGSYKPPLGPKAKNLSGGGDKRSKKKTSLSLKELVKPVIGKGTREGRSTDTEANGNKMPSAEVTSVQEPSVQPPVQKAQGLNANRDVDARFFVRAVVHHAEVFKTTSDAVVAIPEAERTFNEALDAVEMAKCDRRYLRTDSNHIFLNVLPLVPIDIEDVGSICRRMFLRCAARCWNLRVFTVEIKVAAMLSQHTTTPLRFILFNPTGHMLRVEGYVERKGRLETGSRKLISIPGTESPGRMHGTPANAPYPILDRIQRRRIVAQTIETTYVYDFVHLFSRQLQNRWRKYSQARLLGGFRRHKPPATLVEATELILSKNSGSSLVETERPPGENDIGMVAWRYKLFTPEYPEGRELIVIANDITFKAGSFGTAEDQLFAAASALARREGIPRIYLAANSGARIGVAEEVRSRYKVNWKDDHDLTKGFDGLYLSESDTEELKDSVRTTATGDKFQIDSIIGTEHGLGVENLVGSGMIAGETSKAYDDTFTLTYVTSRSVGIGAYIVRLGQRVIQKEKAAPIILTGCSALNKVLGHRVYASNDQIGGVKIMHSNGISHVTVRDDVEAAGTILDWLSFIPNRKGERLPIIESLDPITRTIELAPPPNRVPYDPRVYLINGIYSKTDSLRGFFDRDSFRETLSGWAKTVVVGRARLGGIPTGVIAVETRTMERVVPADPASPETPENVYVQAGQVWYPDSAAKTAQAIRDIGREELPLFIFANWRGFAGGMHDMFDEILKYGSEIVDALRSYKAPVFVYIPPGAELRGGAWVVLDTLINRSVIEMYADPTSRGGVLEPDGVVDVKYRRRELLKTMHRLDPVLKRLDEELSGSDAIHLNDDRKKAIRDSLNKREAEVITSYTSVASSFCDLHDRPTRMLAKGAIRKIVEWKNAREFFYWRLQRRIAETRVRALCKQADPVLSDSEITALLRNWADHRISDHGVAENKESDDKASLFDQDDDRWVYQWLEDEEHSIMERVRKIRSKRIANEVSDLGNESWDGLLDGLEKMLVSAPDPAARANMTISIQQRLEGASNESTKSAIRTLLSRFGI